MTSHTRRAVLATLTSVGLAGCTTSGDSEPPSEDELPEQCPTSLNLGVEWPRDIYTRSVSGFVTRYEAVGEFVTAYEEAYHDEEKADTQFHSPSFVAELEQTPDKLADGFHVTARYTGSVTIEEYMNIQALEVKPDGIPKDRDRTHLVDESAVPDDLEYISIDQIDDQILQSVLKLAADSGYEDHNTAYETRYEELIEDLPPNASFQVHQEMGAYFDVNGTHILLVIDREGGAAEDYGWGFVQYYVSEYVIRRTVDENKSPRNGTVVECRLPE